jgi:hypothetical protein
MEPQTVITIRGPSLSLTLPATIANKPCIIQLSEKAPEVTALVQPNSVDNGLKKTPNVKNIPHINNIIKKAATTTI